MFDCSGSDSDGDPEDISKDYHEHVSQLIFNSINVKGCGLKDIINLVKDIRI